MISCIIAGRPIDCPADSPPRLLMAPWLSEVRWNEQGLVPCVVQDAGSGRPLMLAWMNPEALERTAREGRAVYWSRSRRTLWRKGESSGNEQLVREIRLDCDADTIVLIVEQIGGVACHTGRERCFFRRLENDQWAEVDPVIVPPETLYGER